MQLRDAHNDSKPEATAGRKRPRQACEAAWDLRTSVLRNTRAIVVDRDFNEIARALPRAHSHFTRTRSMLDRVIEQIAERNVKHVRICASGQGSGLAW